MNLSDHDIERIAEAVCRRLDRRESAREDARYRAGFQADPGRTLTKAEIAQLSLTPPDQIRDCRANPQDIFWR